MLKKNSTMSNLSHLMKLSLLCLIFLSGSSTLSAALEKNIEESEHEVSVQPIALLHVQSSSQFLYFTNDKLYGILTKTSTEPDQEYNNLQNQNMPGFRLSSMHLTWQKTPTKPTRLLL